MCLTICINVCVCVCVLVSDLAFRTDKTTHILHHPDNWQFDLLAKSDLLPHVLQRHLLQRAREGETGIQRDEGREDGREYVMAEERVEIKTVVLSVFP